jgi:acetamidase/formamidase
MQLRRLSHTTHHLSGSHHFHFDNSLEPALRIRSGDVVVFECEEAYGGELTADSTTEDLKKLEFDRVHCLTGPVEVEDAEPGDVLEIEVLDFEHDGWAWTGLFPGIGLLADDFGDLQHLHIWRVGADGRAELVPGIRVPVDPFCGIMGVAPREPGAHITLPPRPTGGNLDTRHLVRGSTLYLPVAVPGALFSVGDGHLAQGDGEVCGTALEAPLAVSLRFRAQKGTMATTPQIQTRRPTTSRYDGMGYHMTSAIGDDLYAAAQHAVRDMIRWLEAEHGLRPVDAYILCSAAGDLKISVPKIAPAHTGFVTFSMPKAVFFG